MSPAPLLAIVLIAAVAGIYVWLFVSYMQLERWVRRRNDHADGKACSKCGHDLSNVRPAPASGIVGNAFACPACGEAVSQTESWSYM